MSIIKSKQPKMHNHGFSLIEIMLAILILTTIAVFLLRMQGPRFRKAQVDRASTQITQILSAATSYYIDNGHWPSNTETPLASGTKYPAANTDSIMTLTTNKDKGMGDYLPKSVLNADGKFMSPFNNPYQAGPNPGQTSGGPGTTATYFVVQVDTRDPASAALLKATLPLAYLNKDDPKHTTVTAYIGIPSYDYNHAKAVSNVGVYHPGECVPKPAYACPNGMQAATFVTIEQAYGFSKPIIPGTAAQDDTTTQAITGMSAYIQSGTDEAGNPITDPKPCPNIKAPNTNQPCNGGDRVCVQIRTENGAVELDKKRIQSTYLLAMTKCVPSISQ